MSDDRGDGRLRVLMLVDKVRAGGGAERFMAALATDLPRERFDVTVATTRSAGGRVLELLAEGGVRHVGFHRRGRFDVAPFAKLVAFLRRERIDVIHAHMFGSNLWGSILGRLARVPVVIAHEHTWSYEGEPLRKFLDGHVTGRLVDAFVAVSERDRERMIELEGVPAEKIRVMALPYIPRPYATRVDLRAQLALPADAPLIGSVAVLREQKAVDVLLRAFAQLRVPDAHLLMAGDGHLRPVLEQLARELGIADRAHFLGWWDDVPGLLETVDVAALSSDYEGSPLMALECIMHRAALVSTDVGNVAELMGEGGVTVVPRRDPGALAAALEALLSDPARREAQVRVASARAEGHELPVVTRNFADLYEQLVARAAGRRGRELPSRPHEAD